MSTLQVHVEGIGLWAPTLGDFAALKAQLRGETVDAPPTRPAAIVLPANERRRAPESVLLALEVADQAVAMSGRAASDLPCVFSSAYGDQSISDYMCATLANVPTELSPTKFHNSVHNAPAGYWTIATGCHAASSAITAGHASLGAGLLEAAALCMTEQVPVLLVCSDIAGHGPLGDMSGTRTAFGIALVLAPAITSRTLAHLDLALLPHAGHALHPSPSTGAWYEGNPVAASAWPLVQNLATGQGECTLAAAETLAMSVVLETAA
ncbi:beta-ketoacyl synthase chain length factor [Dyella telluris]|uniref:Beta-ketoacyl synthase chain length factor n=1 Tax=Dyella telluris TaxID=2763498 RepID=A0A7G8Q8Z4_9GAMM|nr:beta-ketoacyl synthase chain length factor [Dyella telluris]QNK03252.1 beta-ketoacyl synthase chain length factor [Dyella telluris]